MMKMVFLCSLFLAISSCGSGSDYDGVFVLSVSPSSAAIVPTTRPNCTDAYGSDSTVKSVGASSIGFSSFGLTWTETNRDIYIIKIQLDLSNSVVGTSIDISDPEEIGNMFGVGSNNDVRIPAKGSADATKNANNMYRSDFKEFTSAGIADSGEESCALTFGGLSVPDNLQTTVGGYIRVVAIAQDGANNQEVIRTEIPVKVIVDTK